MELVQIVLKLLEQKITSMELPTVPDENLHTNNMCTLRRSNAIDGERPYLNPCKPYGDMFDGTHLEDYAKQMDKYDDIYYSIIRYKYWKSIIELIYRTYEQIRQSEAMSFNQSEIDNKVIDELLHHCDFPFKHNDYYATYENVFRDICTDLGMFALLDDTSISEISNDNLESAVKKFIIIIGNIL